MTEQEYRRAYAYIQESGMFPTPAQELYGLAWLAYRWVYGDRPQRAPLSKAWGLTLIEAQAVQDAVDTLIEDLRTPGFGQDQER